MNVSDEASDEVRYQGLDLLALESELVVRSEASVGHWVQGFKTRERR